MAAPGRLPQPQLLLLLLGTAVVALEQPPFVAQESVDLRPHIVQSEVVALEQPPFVAQESVDLRPHIVQSEVVPLGPDQHLLQETLELQPQPEQNEAWQEPRDPSSLPDTVAMGAIPPLRPAWPSVLVGFPPSWPVASAVSYHCQRPPRPPTLPRLPPSGFGHLQRQAAALRALHPRLESCCRQRSPLPCARRAWTEVLDGFCAEEFEVKTRQFHCCRQLGAARRRCFTRGSTAVAAAATAPDGAEASPRVVVTSWEPPQRPSFPPGEPTASNIGNLCELRGLRLSLTAPPRTGGPRDQLQRRLENAFGRCCRQENSLDCARDAWQKELSRFCRESSMVKTRQHRCCQSRGGPARSRCFANSAPHPAYDRELHNISLARPGAGLLRTLCGPTRLLSNRWPVPQLLGGVTATCCSLPPEHRSACAQEQLSQDISRLCAHPQGKGRDPAGCCSRGGPDQRGCFDSSYLSSVRLGAALEPPLPGSDD